MSASPRPPLDLVVLVLNFNTRDHLQACVESLVAEGSTTLADASAPIRAELAIVDNASTDGSASMVAARFPWATLVRAPRNGGFAYGNNLVLSGLKARAVLLLNPDATTPPGAIAELFRVLEAHPESAVVGPKLLRADGTMHLACRRAFPSPSVAFYRLVGLSRRRPYSRRFGRYNLTYLDPDQETEVDAVTGACMLVRQAAIQQVGLLDERFFMYGEDLDWCWRMKAAGWTVRYAPGAVVRHQHGAASRQRPLRVTYHFFRAMDLFYEKHYARQYNPAVTGLVRLGIYAGLAAATLRLLLTPTAARRVGF